MQEMQRKCAADCGQHIKLVRSPAANCKRVFSYSGGVCTFKRDGLNWAKVGRLVRVPYNSATGRLEVSARAAYAQYTALHAEARG